MDIPAMSARPGRNEWVETYTHDHVAQVRMCDGSLKVVNPGEQIVWRDQQCGCCIAAVRVEKPVLS